MDVEDRLAALGAEALGRLLTHRPGLLVGRPPRTLSELVQRLDSRPSVAAACRALSAPQLQVLVATTSVGERVDVMRLAELLGGDPRPFLAQLQDRGLLWVDGDSVVTTAGVRRATPDLLSLGLPFADLAELHPLPVLQHAEEALGLPRSRTRPQATRALADAYADAEFVRRHALDRLPEPAIVDLIERAAGTHRFDDDDDGFFDGGYDGRMSGWERDELVDRLGQRAGLMIGAYPGRSGDVRMPSEVALALRGPAYRIRFDPDPPPVSWLPVSRVESDAAAALAAFDSASTAVLDAAASRPLTTIQAGGVGRRELQRLAKATSLELPTVILVLELAAATGLMSDLQPVTVTDDYRAWRDAEPADRVTRLLLTWWAFPGRPGDDRDENGAARAALSGARCNDCRLARVTLLGALRPDAGLGPPDAAVLAGWHGPGTHLGPGDIEAQLREAATVGAVAQGALTPLGLALTRDDETAVRAAAAAALPASSTEAVFGSDLTVFVAGSPSAPVSALLDACAVRESGGGAVTWRLSTASVRAALDAGRSVDDLRASLRAVAAGGSLPGAVEVLLDDVARVYGRAVVQAAAGVVVSDDETLLVAMLHDRKLAKLELTAVAPTVLVATANAAAIAATLRAAGYLPAYDPGVVHTDDRPAVSWRRRIDTIAVAATADPYELARTLLAARGEPVAVSATEKHIRELNRELSGDEVAVLAAAVDGRERVQLVYESMSGGITERVVRPSGMLGDRIWAWCELRRDDREFLVERVLGVRGV